jgi:hypothetical protein
LILPSGRFLLSRGRERSSSRLLKKFVFAAI